MSAKDDRDNRANQLNPNNSAYASSRSGCARDDDDYVPAQSRASFQHRSLPREGDMPAKFKATIVGSGGQCIAVRADFSYPTRSSLTLQHRHFDDDMLSFAKELEVACVGSWGGRIVYALVLNGSRLIHYQGEARPIAEHSAEAVVERICSTPESMLKRKELNPVELSDTSHLRSLLSESQRAIALAEA